MKIPLLGQSGEDRFDDNSTQLTQNWYPHIASGGKSQLALYPTPGETLFADVGVGPIRGEIDYNGTYFVVSGTEFYEVDAAGNETLRGTLSTSTGRCTLAHNGAFNGKQIIIADGTQGYIWDTTYNTFAIIELKSSGNADTNTVNKLVDSSATFVTDGVVAGMVAYNTTDGTQCIVSAVDSETSLSLVNSAGVATDTFPLGTEAYEVGDGDYPSTATHVLFMDGYFLANDPTNSGRYYKSAGYQGYDWSGTDFTTAERSPDELQGILKADRVLWLVGKTTAEPSFNSGASDFPFEPISSGFSEWGTCAPYSLVSTTGLAFWLSQNEEGNGLIVMASGIQVKSISTPEIAAEIAAMSDITDCYAYSYQAYQHPFVVFTFPTGGKTLVYDISTQMWHTWASYSLGYHRSTGHTFIYNKHLVGDPTNGRIYYLDYDAKTDNGYTIARIRRSATIHSEDKVLDYEVVELDIKEGVGDATTPDPQIHLRWRDNNGAWSNYHSRSMGKVGERGKKVRWRRLGRSDQRVFEITVTDPVTAVLLDGYARVKQDKEEFR